MPTVRKKIPPKKKFKNKLPADLHEYLLYGNTTNAGLDLDNFDIVHPQNDEEVERLDNLLDTHGEDLLKEWAKKEGLGSRPFFWWHWESPDELRERIKGEGNLWPCLHKFFTFGINEVWDWKSVNKENPPVFESQAAYLKRHGFLTVEEQRVLTEKDFQPENIYKILRRNPDADN